MLTTTIYILKVPLRDIYIRQYIAPIILLKIFSFFFLIIEKETRLKFVLKRITIILSYNNKLKQILFV